MFAGSTRPSVPAGIRCVYFFFREIFEKQPGDHASKEILMKANGRTETEKVRLSRRKRARCQERLQGVGRDKGSLPLRCS